MSTDAKWISEMAGKRHLDLSLGQAGSIQKMLVDGDLQHIDGPVITALADLADIGRTEYRGVAINTRLDASLNGRFVVSEGSGMATADDAMEAILMADSHLSGKHTLPAPNMQVAS